MKSPLTRRTITYIVRVWLEYLHATPPVWRGEVASVDGEDVHHFKNLEDLNAFIRRSVEMESEEDIVES